MYLPGLLNHTTNAISQHLQTIPLSKYVKHKSQFSIATANDLPESIWDDLSQ